jgi:hypothetical protein
MESVEKTLFETRASGKNSIAAVFEVEVEEFERSITLIFFSSLKTKLLED